MLSGLATGKTKARARAIGIPFEGLPGKLNAITDVEGVEVGHTTLIRGEGPLRRGTGPIRTGVTAILPRGRGRGDPTFAAWFSLNGRGEMTGTTWVEESGILEGPVMLTNTLSVGVVRDAVVAWKMIHGPETIFPWTKPVVAETWDGYLNDIFGFHVKQEHVFDALENARSGPVPEGNVGGGTGMICHEFKGGIGTSSRKLTEEQGGYTVGILVQANYGSRDQLRVAGVPVGLEIGEDREILIAKLPAFSGDAVSQATDLKMAGRVYTSAWNRGGGAGSEQGTGQSQPQDRIDEHGGA